METLQKNIVSHLDALVEHRPKHSMNLKAKMARQEVMNKYVDSFIQFLFFFLIYSFTLLCSLLATVDFDETARMMDDQYIGIVRAYEASANRANPSQELTRLVYIIFGAVEFAHALHNLESVMNEVEKEDRNRYRVVFKNIFFHIFHIFLFLFFILDFSRDVIWNCSLLSKPEPVKFVKETFSSLKDSILYLRDTPFRY